MRERHVWITEKITNMLWPVCLKALNHYEHLPHPLSLNHVFLTSSLAVQNVFTITFVQTYL